MTALDYIHEQFAQSIATKEKTVSALSETVAHAADLIIQRLMAGSKVLACGNGGSAADAQHFASELINRFELRRRGLPAIALTTDSSTITSIANDFCYEDIFSRQIDALAQPGDVLLGISTSGNSPNVERAVNEAQNANCLVIGLTGRGGGKIGRLLRPHVDIELCVPDESTARVQEAHILIIHCLCGLIDQHFSTQEKSP
jgi:D-sedoheptulose 7-phosphate isomerase